MRVPVRFAILVLVARLLGAPAAASARPIEVPTFAIDPLAEVVGPRVAAHTDGTMVFAWQRGGDVVTQWIGPTGGPLTPPVAIASGDEPRLAADTRGGYVVAYLRASGGVRHLFGRRLDAAGQPIGSEIAVDQLPDDEVRLPTVLGTSWGFAFVWQQDIHCRLRRYDAAGVPLGEAQTVGENGWTFPLVAAALDDGGITVVWHDPSVHTLLGRVYDADGSTRLVPVFVPSLGFDPHAIAATVTGGVVLAGVYLQTTVRLIEYDPSFAIVRQQDVATLAETDRPHATVARGGAGRWLVAYATARYDASFTTLQGYLPLLAQPLGADLAPLEPAFALTEQETPRVVTAPLPSGSFVNAWATVGAPGEGRGFADVVSLCTPDVHVCGDGVFDPRCEECDAGAANDDTAPDACRTSCTLPHCGDAVVDAGEICDDGSPSSCDGCDAACQPVAGLACGDGILVAGCGDQCDDGNAVIGDGCAPTCTLERVAGGGSAATDCLAEWIVPNPTNVPLVDGRGRFRRTQRCVDDDPACDFDGGTPGTCTFHVAVCAGNGDVPGCVASPLTAFELTKPSVKQAARRPELAAVRAVFAPVAATLVGAPPPDRCTAPLAVVVPLRGTAPRLGKGTLALSATATAAGSVRDKDALKLVCLPR